MEKETLRIAKTIPYNKRISRAITTPGFKMYYRDKIIKTSWYCYQKRQISQSILTEEPEINLKGHFTHQLFLKGFPLAARIPRLFEKMKPDYHYMSLVSGSRDCGLVFSLPSNPLCISPLAELSAGSDLKDPSWFLMATLWKQPNALRVVWTTTLQGSPLRVQSNDGCRLD